MPRTLIPVSVLTLLFALVGADTFAGVLDDPETPVITACETGDPVTLDGEINPEEWVRASSPAAFVGIQSGSPASDQPGVLVMWDAEALYVAARMSFPRGHRPVARTDARDGALWEDDALEVFLDPDHDHGDYFQFIANAKGEQWDSRGQDKSWDAEWDAAAKTGPDYWSVELRIPFASLGVAQPANGTTWGLNVAWDRQTPSPMVASWAHLKGRLHDPEHFAHLAFWPESPAVQIAGPERPDGTTLRFSGTWRTKVPVEARLEVARKGEEAAGPGGSATAVYAGGQTVSPLRLDVQLPKAGNLPAPGEYRVALSVLEAGRLTHLVTAPLSVSEPLEIALRKFFLSGRLEVDVNASGLGRPSSQIVVTVAVLDQSGKRLLREQAVNLTDDVRGTTGFDVSKLAPGDYQVGVVAGIRRGPRLKEATVSFTKPPVPDWVGSKEGLSDEVLAPWTPVEVAGGVARVWGRDYSFGPLPFPAQIVAAEEAILAGPVVLSLVADGKAKTFRQVGDLRTISAHPEKAQLGLTAAGEGVECEGQITVEYDGMVRTDFTVRPKGIRQIDELSLIIPIKAENAKYLYHYPGRWGSAYNAGALPAEGFTAGFRPFIWLGDEERGLAWFTESDKGFSVDDPEQVTQITRDGDVVRLRINIIRGGQRVSGPLQYTFGFQATPVKPMQPSAWDYRICHHGGYGIEDQEYHVPANLSYPAEGSIRLDQGTFEAWVRPRFDPQVEVTEEGPAKGRFNRSLFDVAFDNSDHIGFYWNIDDRGMRVYYKQGEKYPLILSSHAEWKADEWHHVAFTWGDQTCIYLDGVKVAETAYKGTLPRGLQNARVTLRQGMGEACEFDVDEVRISDVARESFDLSAAPQADEHTLLLDHLDGDIPAGSEREQSPDVGTAGLASGGVSVAGKFGNGFGQGAAEGTMTLLDRLAELGVRTICFHEHWTDIQNHTSTTHGEKLRKLVAACHERGIKLLLYFGYEISDIAPEWGVFSEDCLVAPRAGGYTRQPAQTAYIVCYRSKWQDFMAEGMARMMDEYDIDGVYLDGTANPWGCTNTLHGCGYTKPDGSTGTVYPIFDTRDMMRRIYTLVKTRKPDGQVNVHQSTCMTIPTLAWATSYWDGEQFGFMDRGPDPLTVLPLDAFRCEFMGHNFGVPAEFLCYNRPYTYSEAMAFTLLHDVLVRGSLGGSLGMESKLWKGMEEFGREGATWLPYWDNSDYVKLGPDDSVKASIYSRAEAGCVVVVSNLGNIDKQATMQLDYEGLLLSAGMKAVDMLTGDEYPLSENGEASFGIAPFGFKVLWVR